MARVDHEEVVRRLEKALVAGQPTKTSWGVRELRLMLADLRIECEVPETPMERHWRLFGEELTEAIFNRRLPDGAVPSTQDASEDADDRVAKPRPEEIPTASDHREAEGPEGSRPWQRSPHPPPPEPMTRTHLAAVPTP